MVAKVSIPVFVIFVLSGCQLRPTIVSARARSDGASEFIELSVNAADAKQIKERQIYFSMDVMECAGGESAFHVVPYVEGQRASEFKYRTTGDLVTFVGTLPSKIFDRYSSPCVHLEGGSYFHGKLKSAPIRISKSDSPR